MAARKTAPATLSPEDAAGAAQGWQPEPGDNLTGKVVHLEMIESEYGEYPMLTIQTGANTYVNLHAFHQVLQRGLRRIKPMKGDQVSVTYHGKQETKKVNKDGTKQEFHNYTVRDPNKPVEEFSWGSDDAAF